MAFLTDLANVNTATTGAGTMTLGSAVSGYQSFAASGVVSGDWVQYRISDATTAWEIGWGVYNSTGPTLTRNLISSSTGSLLSLSGSATVFVDAGAASLLMPYAHLFGTGSDGSLSAGFGTVTLTRDTCYANVTFGASDQIITNGYLLCAQSIDLSNASANAIIPQAATALQGNAASGSTAGGTIFALTQISAGMGGGGAAGGNGNTGAGSTGTNGAGGNGVASLGYGGTSGGGSSRPSGGAGSSGAGAFMGSFNTITNKASPIPALVRFTTYTATTLYPMIMGGGGGGAGGGGGGGDGTNAGGGGGSGGASPPRLAISARVLMTGSNPTAGLIAAQGAPGGAGGNGAGGNAGGGGGGCGAGGGAIYLIVGTRVGSVVTNGLDASSGAGGLGGNGVGTGTGGTGGSSGYSGGIELINIVAGSYASTQPNNGVGVQATTASSATGTAGAASVTARQNL